MTPQALTEQHKQNLPRGLATGDTDTINHHSQGFWLVSVIFSREGGSSIYSLNMSETKMINCQNPGFVLPVNVTKCLFVCSPSGHTSLPICLSGTLPSFLCNICVHASQIEVNGITFVLFITFPLIYIYTFEPWFYRLHYSRSDGASKSIFN